MASVSNLHLVDNAAQFMLSPLRKRVGMEPFSNRNQVEKSSIGHLKNVGLDLACIIAGVVVVPLALIGCVFAAASDYFSGRLNVNHFKGVCSGLSMAFIFAAIKCPMLIPRDLCKAYASC